LVKTLARMGELSQDGQPSQAGGWQGRLMTAKRDGLRGSFKGGLAKGLGRGSPCGQDVQGIWKLVEVGSAAGKDRKLAKHR